MATQTVLSHPLDVAYAGTAIESGAVPHHELDLRYFGGRTIPHLTWLNVYAGTWDRAERRRIDDALAAAMTDAGLNNVLAQYFPGARVTARFAGSRSILDCPASVDAPDVKELVAPLDGDGAAAIVLFLPRGAVLRHGDVTSMHGLGGFHGSVHLPHGRTLYYAVAVYCEGSNGIVLFPEPWQNICATVYHELQEIRTDPDVEDAINGAGDQVLGWYSPRGGEIGDVAIVMRQVPLADRSGMVPVQLMWSNAVGGPEGPINRPHRRR